MFLFSVILLSKVFYWLMFSKSRNSIAKERERLSRKVNIVICVYGYETINKMWCFL
jgi:hypothetical protein